MIYLLHVRHHTSTTAQNDLYTQYNGLHQGINLTVHYSKIQMHITYDHFELNEEQRCPATVLPSGSIPF